MALINGLNVTRYGTADAFLSDAAPLLLTAEAENNLMLGIAHGLARQPAAATHAYLATVATGMGIHACAVHVPPFKLVVTRGSLEAITELARDGFDAGLQAGGVTGPSESAGDFAVAWSRLSGIEPRLAMRLRIHEARHVVDSELPAPCGRFRPAAAADHTLLTEWTEVFVSDARVADAVDAPRVVHDAIARGRLYVWEDGAPVSMAAWAGRTPNGVRINFVYTPRELRRKGYATACVTALTRQQLEQGNAFCWLYTDASTTVSSNIFERIGYRPACEMTEYSW